MGDLPLAPGTAAAAAWSAAARLAAESASAQIPAAIPVGLPIVILLLFALAALPPARLRLRPARPPRLDPVVVRQIAVPAVGIAAALLLFGASAPAAVVLGLAAVPVIRWARRRSRPPPPGEMREVAGALDLFAACLDSGLDPAGALVACCARPGLPPPVREAFARSAALIALGADATVAWLPLAEHPLLEPVAGAAARAALGGTRLAGAARETATDLRSRCRRTADGAAARAGVAMTGPLALCFLPAFICLGLAPVVIGLVGSLQLW